MPTATATATAPVRSDRALLREVHSVVQAPDDELSVDVDLMDLEQATAASDNVFLQPTPPELCPWGVASEAPAALVQGPIEQRRAMPPVNVIQVNREEVLNSETLPRFSLLGPDSSRYGVEVAPLPRFADC